MSDKNFQQIIDSFSWIKVSSYKEADLRNPCIDWKSEYVALCKHHREETEFLIEKCKELAILLINKEK